MKELTKILVLALFIIAGVTFILQVSRNPFAWVWVSIYWGTLTAKNYIDWLNKKGEK